MRFEVIIRNDEGHIINHTLLPLTFALEARLVEFSTKELVEELNKRING